MKQFLPTLCSLGVLLGLSAVAGAQPAQLPEPLYSQNFDENTTPWLVMGEKAKVSVERAAANVKVGGGAMRFDYGVGQGQTSPLLTPLAPMSLTTLRSISFWVKADHDSSLVFALQEQGGGRFGAVFSVLADQWQKVELAPEDLVLQVDTDDPKDENGKLDLDKIEAAALLDFNQVFAQLGAGPNNPMATMLGVQNGARTIYVDDLVFSSKPISQDKREATVIDDFKHPQVGWLQVGGMMLKTVEDAQTKVNMLEASYAQNQNRIPCIVKPLTLGVLSKRKELILETASRRRATLIVQLEEKSGGKYNAVLEVPADTDPTVQTLRFEDFKRADDSKDDNDRLDLDQVKQLLIIDGSALLGQGEGDNTLWLSQIRVK